MSFTRITNRTDREASNLSPFFNRMLILYHQFMAVCFVKRALAMSQGLGDWRLDMICEARSGAEVVSGEEDTCSRKDHS